MNASTEASPAHHFDPGTDFCDYCGVPKYAVLEDHASAICGNAPASTLNHGGPGMCTLCYPHGAPRALQPTEQGELAL